MALSDKQRRARTQAPEMHLAIEDGAQQIPVDRIQTDGGTQMRAGLDDSTVEDYARAIAEGVQLPAIEVYYDGEVYWLADGFHRVAAHRRECDRNGIDYGCIQARVHSGTRRDTILHAAGANHAHGLRRTNADIERAVTTILRDEEWRNWSNAEIARVCHVDPKTVSNYRRRLETTQEIPESSSRKTASGRTINTSNIGGGREVEQPAESDDYGDDDESLQAAAHASMRQLYDLPAGWRIIPIIANQTASMLAAVRDQPNTTPVATPPHQNVEQLRAYIDEMSYNPYFFALYGLSVSVLNEISSEQFITALSYVAAANGASGLHTLRMNRPDDWSDLRMRMLNAKIRDVERSADSQGQEDDQSHPDNDADSSDVDVPDGYQLIESGRGWSWRYNKAGKYRLSDQHYETANAAAFAAYADANQRYRESIHEQDAAAPAEAADNSPVAELRELHKVYEQAFDKLDDCARLTGCYMHLPDTRRALRRILDAIDSHLQVHEHPDTEVDAE